MDTAGAQLIFFFSLSPGPQLCTVQLGGMSSPQLTQARHSHMLRGCLIP